MCPIWAHLIRHWGHKLKFLKYQHWFTFRQTHSRKKQVDQFKNSRIPVNISLISVMDFRNKDPGAVQYGNFINYYQFNSAEERLKLISTEHWLEEEDRHQSTKEPYLVLDVGCNSGNFTQLLQKYLSSLLPQRQVFVYGVDIDDTLIKRARAENTTDSNSYDCVDVMDNEAFEKVTQYLATHQRTQFDAICCFSITMWIHLNHHDVGLQEFLRKLSSLAKLFVVEPQPWKCYQTAERRLKKSGEVFPLFLDLKWRSQVEDEIQNYLETTLQRRKVYESCPTKWKRKICFYR